VVVGVGAEMIGADVVGVDFVGAEAVGTEAVGEEVVRAEMVGADVVGTEIIGDSVFFFVVLFFFVTFLDFSALFFLPFLAFFLFKVLVAISRITSSRLSTSGRPLFTTLTISARGSVSLSCLPEVVVVSTGALSDFVSCVYFLGAIILALANPSE